MENKIEKKSKLVFDAKLTRKLLKINDEIRYCPHCGKSITEECECKKNIIVDIKPYRGENGVLEKDRSVFVFLNNSSFQATYNQLLEEAKTQKTETLEPVEGDFD